MFMAAFQRGLLSLFLMLACVEIEYGSRLLKQGFLRFQWVFSTLEYRSPRHSRRLHARLVASTLKYIVSPLQANWALSLIFCFIGFVGGAVLWLFFTFLLDPGLDHADAAVWVWLIFIGFLGFTFAGASLCIFFMILWDLVRRAMRTYGWAWQERWKSRD
jgi:hypothetical protein